MLRTSLCLAAYFLMAGCVVTPSARVVRPAPVEGDLIVYPQQGQSPAQLDRDRYECHLWAVQQSGVDPSQGTLPAPVYPAPAVDTAASIGASAVVGAFMGAVLGSPWHAGADMAIGALTGAAVGAVAAGTINVEAQATAPASQPFVGTLSYRRALEACLDGRGYTVR